MNAQDGWYWCNKCQGLIFQSSPFSPPPPCPKGGSHDATGSGGYLVNNNDPSDPGQHGWRWCNKCCALWYSGGGAGFCAAGGGHSDVGSGDYSLSQNITVPNTQSGWRWCNKCQMLTFAGGSQLGTCPKDHQVHDHKGSGNYNVIEYGPFDSNLKFTFWYAALVAFNYYDDGAGSHTAIDEPQQWVLYNIQQLINDAGNTNFLFDIKNLRVRSYFNPPYTQGLNSLPGDTGGVLTPTFSTTVNAHTNYSDAGIWVIMIADKGKELTLEYPLVGAGSGQWWLALRKHS